MADGLQDRDLQDYYESMIEMFASKGWTYFIQDMQRLFVAADSVQEVDGLQELGFRQGQADMIKLVVSQPAVIDAAYDMLLKAEDNE
jgi:hypothetical protein